MKKYKKIFIAVLFALWTAFAVLGARAYYYKPDFPLDVDLQYFSDWYCIKNTCGVIIITPDGVMIYRIPDNIHEEFYILYLKKNNLIAI